MKTVPVFNALTEKYANNDAIRFRRVDCDREQKNFCLLCFDEDVNGFPTIIMYKDGKQLREFLGKRNFEELDDFVESHLRPQGISAWLLREQLRNIEYQAKKNAKLATASTTS